MVQPSEQQKPHVDYSLHPTGIIHFPAKKVIRGLDFQGKPTKFLISTKDAKPVCAKSATAAFGVFVQKNSDGTLSI
jgi:hypothetical protein